MMPTVPDGDPRVASVRELLFFRLDLQGEGGALRPAEPVIPLEEFGAVEVWAFEHPDPFVHFAFYLYESEASFDSQVDDVPWAENSQLRSLLPEGAEVSGGFSSGNLAVAFYYPDGSRGDPNEADGIMSDILTRTAGYE